jgi:hypothetical protein
MMAHVWNEIEHDIGYKPEAEGPSEAELGLLETLGHLTRAGDAAITRLLAANIARMAEQTGDFSDIHDFVARLRPYFPGADLSVNAGLAFDESQALGLTSIDRMRAGLGEEALAMNLAQARIADFNTFLARTDKPELSFNPMSADLLTIGLLHARIGDILANRVEARDRGRPPRIYYIAKAFDEFRSADVSDAQSRD